MVVASSTLIACDDFLDREPLDQVSQPTFWKTPEHLDAYIVVAVFYFVSTFSLSKVIRLIEKRMKVSD